MIQVYNTSSIGWLETGAPGGRALEAGVTTSADQHRRGNIGPYRCLAVKSHEIPWGFWMHVLKHGPLNIQDLAPKNIFSTSIWLWFYESCRVVSSSKHHGQIMAMICA